MVLFHCIIYIFLSSVVILSVSTHPFREKDTGIAFLFRNDLHYDIQVSVFFIKLFNCPSTFCCHSTYTTSGAISLINSREFNNHRGGWSHSSWCYPWVLSRFYVRLKLLDFPVLSNRLFYPLSSLLCLIFLDCSTMGKY